MLMYHFILILKVVSFQRSQMRLDSNHKSTVSAISGSDQHRNNAILHSLYREWSIEGKAERDLSFTPLLDSLKKYLPVNERNAYVQTVLVPGCGLGRLPLEIAAAGYSAQGNEFSAFMVAPANFVLNQINKPNKYQIHPWIDRYVTNVINH